MPEDLNIPNNNLKIDQALKELEAKSVAEQNSYKAVKFYNETDTPKMVQLVMKISGGAIKDQRQAEYILLGFVIIAIIISLFLVLGGGGGQISTVNIKNIDQNQYSNFK